MAIKARLEKLARAVTALRKADDRIRLIEIYGQREEDGPDGPFYLHDFIWVDKPAGAVDPVIGTRQEDDTP